MKRGYFVMNEPWKFMNEIIWIARGKYFEVNVAIAILFVVTVCWFI